MPKAKQSLEKSSNSTGGSKQSASVTVFPQPSGVTVEEHIRQRAYELYEERGRAEGQAEQDWLRAEAELNGRTAKRTA